MMVTWQAVGVILTAGFVLVGGVIALWVSISKQGTKIENLESQVKECKADMRDHEKLNEATFTKIETAFSRDFGKLYEKIDEIYKYIIHSNK